MGNRENPGCLRDRGRSKSTLNLRLISLSDSAERPKIKISKVFLLSFQIKVVFLVDFDRATLTKSFTNKSS
jgi:hypothetical protein